MVWPHFHATDFYSTCRSVYVQYTDVHSVTAIRINKVNQVSLAPVKLSYYPIVTPVEQF